MKARAKGWVAGLGLRILGVALGLTAAASGGMGNEVPTPIFSFDQAGGTTLPSPTTTTVQIQFNPTASLPQAAIAGRFYRMVWEFNAAGVARAPNPEITVTGCGATGVSNLGVTPSLVVSPGANNLLETVPDPNDILSNPPGQPPEIHTGNDSVPDTVVTQNFVVKAGTDGILSSSPRGDDQLTSDQNPNSPTFGQPVIVAGANGVAESFAFPGVCVKAGPGGVIGATPGGDDYICPGGDPETGFDVVLDGGNQLCETVAGNSDIQVVGIGVMVSDDGQAASVGASVSGFNTNIVVHPGPNGTLESSPLNDDDLATDARGMTVITVGANQFANSVAFGDDVQVLQIGDSLPGTPDELKPVVSPMAAPPAICITPGPNGVLDSFAAGDDREVYDSQGRRVIVSGANLTSDSNAVADDIICRPGPAPYNGPAVIPNYLVPPEVPNYNYAFWFTDDIQIQGNGAVAATNPGTDTGYTTDLSVAKAIQCVLYSWPTITPYNEVQQIVLVRLRFYVAQDQYGRGAVESVFERLIHLSLPNFMPMAIAELGTSQSNAIAPGTPVSVNLSNAYDQDGYPLWAMIDWGDGNTTILTEAQLAQLPEVLGDLSHPGGGYATSGIYKITFYMIDNGRLLLSQRATFLATGQLADPKAQPGDPAPSSNTDPLAVLQDAIAFQVANPPAFSLPAPGDPTRRVDSLGNKIDPVLNQDSILMQVLGGFSARTGRFKSRLTAAGSDQLALSMDLRGSSTFREGDVVTITLTNPTSSASLTIGSGTLTGRSSLRLVDPGTGLRATFNSARRMISIKMSKADLKNMFSYFQQTGAVATSASTDVQNGYCEVVISISVAGGSTIFGQVRFVYNSNATIGSGTSPNSLNDS